jgi:hypothetical protein
MEFEPSDPCRWAFLGLADPDPSGRLPERATTADVLAFALMPPGSPDPVEGIVNGVRVDLNALVELLQEHPASEILKMDARRLEAAMILLRRHDLREPTPPDAPDEGPPKAPADEATPASAPASDVEDTRNQG